MELYVLFYEETSCDNGTVDRFVGVFSEYDKAAQYALSCGYQEWSVEEGTLNKP